MCKSRSPAALNEAIVTTPAPPLTPPTLARGPHTPVKPRRPQHQSIHSAEPLAFIRNTHTNSRDFHIRSRLEGRSLETRSADSLLLSTFLSAGDVLSSQQEPERREKSYALGLRGFRVSVLQRHTYRFRSRPIVRTKHKRPWLQMCVFAGRLGADVTMGFCPPCAPSPV